MMNITLSPEETGILREILHHELNEVDMEIFRTDTRDFREMLKQRRAIVDRLLTKLSSIPMATPAVPRTERAELRDS